MAWRQVASVLLSRGLKKVNFGFFFCGHCEVGNLAEELLAAADKYNIQIKIRFKFS